MVFALRSILIRSFLGSAAAFNVTNKLESSTSPNYLTSEMNMVVFNLPNCVLSQSQEEKSYEIRQLRCSRIVVLIRLSNIACYHNIYAIEAFVVLQSKCYKGLEKKKNFSSTTQQQPLSLPTIVPQRNSQ